MRFTRCSPGFNIDELSQLKQETLDFFQRYVEDEVRRAVNDDVNNKMGIFFNEMDQKKSCLQRKLDHVDLILTASIPPMNKSFLAVPAVITPFAIRASYQSLVYAYGMWGLKAIGFGAAGFVGTLAVMGVSAVAFKGYKEWITKRVRKVPGKSKQQYVQEWIDELIEKTNAKELTTLVQKQLQDSVSTRLQHDSEF